LNPSKGQGLPVNNRIILCSIFLLVFASCAPTVESVTPVQPTVESVEATQTRIATAVPTATDVPVPTATEVPTATAAPVTIKDVIDYEMRGSFNFFWEQANTDVGSPGYGLIRDRYPGSEGIASIASVGFGLTAYLVGIEFGYVTEQEVYDRVNGTLDTLLAMDRIEGFYFHFIDMETGERAWSSEISSIDSAILMMGVLSVGEYFGGEIENKAYQIYDTINWPWFIDESRDIFFMAYRPGEGYSGYWDFYAEQLMLYVLAAGSDTYPIEDTTYYEFIRDIKRYGDGEKFIHSWFGSIFTYQFSHAWIDFRDYIDDEGVNWFDNSVAASLAQYNFAVDNDAEYLTLGPNAWGLSACDGPDGYNGLYGAPPSGYDNNSHTIDDTIPPYGAIGSIIFLPEQAQQAMLYYYSLERLRGPYGFMDAFNLSKDWFASDVIGIDKGISLLMLANYQYYGVVQRIMMSNENILNGLNRLHLLVR
jgi:hypothetical protein